MGQKSVELCAGGAGTHLAVWPLLSHWSTLGRAADLTDKIIAPEGLNLSLWLDALGILTPAAAIYQDWFTTWGIDLSKLSEDHESRNMVSYRPSELRFPSPPSAQEAIKFISELWALFEPKAGGRFPQVERELLRKIFKKYGNPTKLNAAALQNELGIDSTMADYWVSFLKENDDSLPLDFAAQSSEVEKTNCSLQVVSRAAYFFFLRLAQHESTLLTRATPPICWSFSGNACVTFASLDQPTRFLLTQLICGPTSRITLQR